MTLDHALLCLLLDDHWTIQCCECLLLDDHWTINCCECALLDDHWTIQCCESLLLDDHWTIHYCECLLLYDHSIDGALVVVSLGIPLTATPVPVDSWFTAVTADGVVVSLVKVSAVKDTPPIPKTQSAKNIALAFIPSFPFVLCVLWVGLRYGWTIHRTVLCGFDFATAGQYTAPSSMFCEFDFATAGQYTTPSSVFCEFDFATAGQYTAPSSVFC